MQQAQRASQTRHEERTRRLAEILELEHPSPGAPFACPYLPERAARYLTVGLSSVAPGLYHALMDLNFRRLGRVFYRPDCGACQECRMIRVPVRDFRPSRVQRRCLARNADVDVQLGPPVPTTEKYDLYRSYLEARHDRQMDGSREEFESFLYDSSVETVELTLRVGNRLVGVGIADVQPLAMSAVYFYFDPSERSRSLGVFNVLWLAQECRRRDLSFLYLGYYVRDSPKMTYKANYAPHEVLSPEGVWTTGSGGR